MTDKIDLVNRSVDAFAYRMSGDTNRELWYDADGLRAGLASGSALVLLIAGGMAIWGRERR